MQTSQYNVYSLPIDLLLSLTPRNLVNRIQQRSPSPQPVSNVLQSSGSRACAVCLGVMFIDVNEQRLHVKSDWHRYNVKTRLRGSQPISEANFAQMVDALEDSLSGSASSSDEDFTDSDAVNTLLDKSKRLQARSSSPESESRLTPRTALTWFHSPPSTQIGIYRAIFPLNTETDAYLQTLKDTQVKGEGRTWAMFMVAGGHFAGALVRVSRSDDGEDEDETSSKKKKPKKPKPEIEVLKHKTFHRYTTRRKQGGSQSVNDNAKGNAKSAGAQLRRYGEQALRDDIRSLLQDWAEDIQDCERIWIRANTSNRRIFIDFEGTPIQKGDERLRTFPFPTRRPTQSELLRCLNELVRPKISHFTEEDLRVQDEAYLASLPKPKPVPVIVAVPESEKPKPIKFTKEEELFREKWSRLLEMVNKGRLEVLKAFWEREGTNLGGIDAQIPDWTGEKRSTLLQLAAQGGHEDVVQWLLEEARANPTILVPLAKVGEEEEEDGGHRSDASDSPRALPKGTHRTAYDLARTKGVRDAFRRSAAAHPDWWDWLGAARVPSVLSKEMEEERDEKRKVRRKGLKDRVREREAKEKERVRTTSPDPPPQVTKTFPMKDLGPSRRLGGAAGDVQGVAGLTPEMRARVERERRARAAEARLKSLGTK